GTPIDGPLSLAAWVDQVKRFEAAGWAAERIDGHDPAAIAAAIARAQTAERPSLIACKTTIAYGAPTKAGSEKSHGAPLGADEIAGARKKLGWVPRLLEGPADILSAWRPAGGRGKVWREAWSKRLASKDAGARGEFERRIRGDLPAQALANAVAAMKDKLAAETKDIATRAAS